jgi:hypothetical protein
MRLYSTPSILVIGSFEGDPRKGLSFSESDPADAILSEITERRPSP